MKKHIFKPKLVAFLLTVALITSGVSTVFADDLTSGSTTVTTSTYNGSTPTTNTYDGNLSTIDSLYNQVIILRQQEKDLNVVIKAQQDINSAALKTLYSQINPDDIAKINSVNAENKAIKVNNKSLFDQWNLLNQQYRDARKAKDEKLSTELRLQINHLKINQVQPLLDQIKNNDKAIKDVRDRVNAKRKQISTILNPIKTLEKQITPFWNTVKSSEQQKIEAWKEFNTAVNNGDVNAAVQTLTRIVSLKQQILDAKKQINAIQLQIKSALNVN